MLSGWTRTEIKIISSYNLRHFILYYITNIVVDFTWHKNCGLQTLSRSTYMCLWCAWDRDCLLSNGSVYPVLINFVCLLLLQPRYSLKRSTPIIARILPHRGSCICPTRFCFRSGRTLPGSGRSDFDRREPQLVGQLPSRIACHPIVYNNNKRPETQ